MKLFSLGRTVLAVGIHISRRLAWRLLYKSARYEFDSAARPGSDMVA